jgi:hypothetical protein
LPRSGWRVCRRIGIPEGSGGVAVRVLGAGFLGFLTGDVRVGDNLSGRTA